MSKKTQSVIAVLAALGGVAVAWGYLDAGQAGALTGAVTAIVTALHIDFGWRPKK